MHNNPMTTPAQPGRVNQAASGRDKLDAYIDRIKYLPPTPSLMIKLVVLFKNSSPDLTKWQN